MSDLRKHAEEAAEEAWFSFVSDPTCGDPEGVDKEVLQRLFADAIEREAKAFAGRALTIALSSPGVRVEFYPTNPPRSLAPKIIEHALKEAEG